jgi:glutamine synthetase
MSVAPSEESLSQFTKKLKAATDGGAKIVDLQFVDIFGNLKFESVTIDEFKDVKVFADGVKIDGSSIYGYGVPVEESDLLIIPDPDTFCPVPWTEDVWRAVCTVHHPRKAGGGYLPFEADSRNVLKGNLERIPEVLSKHIEVDGKEFRFYVAPELEFFVLDKCSGDFARIDDKGYFDAPPARGRALLGKIMEAMGTMGIRYEAYHKEVAPSQYEVDFRYGRAIKIADATITIKDIIRQYADRENLVATFMPKPFEGMNGSGMHTHQNLAEVKGGVKTNLFYDKDGGDLSQIALHYIGGLLHHARAITAITNPTANSYKRLVPGWEAPVNIAWGRKNRTALIRVPYGEPASTRIEYRSPDPSANPYLAFAVMLAAGLDGIEKEIDPGKATEVDLYKPGPGRRFLPGSLTEALDELEKDKVIEQALGKHIMTNFLSIKRQEVELYNSRPSNIDYEMYLGV